MYDFTAAFIAFFALAGIASAFAVAALVRVAVEQRTTRTHVVSIGGGQRPSFRRAA